MLHFALTTLTLVLPTLLAVPIQETKEPRPQIQPPVDAPAPDAPDATAQESKFATAQLEQIVAPIALYPDVLLSQVLMASTYPLEVVEAHRFVQANPKLAGDELEAALKDKDWDPSVKSMCGFPDLLARMNDNLDWLRDLGDAFLAQEPELMDAVQQMRRTAFDAGTLKTTKEQAVREEDDYIVIEPASPEVIYVPVYYPTYVYGGWGYPWWYYPRLYVGPPPGRPYFFFHVGFACMKRCASTISSG